MPLKNNLVILTSHKSIGTINAHYKSDQTANTTYALEGKCLPALSQESTYHLAKPPPPFCS